MGRPCRGEEGLYSLSAFGVRTTGQRWAVDDCRTAVTCPLPFRLPTWSPVMTVRLAAGRHRFTVDLGPGDSVGQVRLERRKDTGPDYARPDVLRARRVPEPERLALQPPSWESPIAEPPATAPCQPPSSPVVPDPCAGR